MPYLKRQEPATTQPLQECFTLKLTKKMALFLKNLLPSRYSFQITKLKKRECTPISSLKRDDKKQVKVQAEHKKEIAADCESRQNLDQNGQIAKKRQKSKQKLTRSETLSTELQLAQQPLETHDQLFQDAIKKFLQMIRNNNQIQKILRKELQQLGQKVESKFYKSFAQFKQEHEKVLTKLRRRKICSEILLEFQDAFKEVQFIYRICSQSDRQLQQIIDIANPAQNPQLGAVKTKASKSQKKRNKREQKESRIGGTNKKTTKLPSVLFEVPQEEQSDSGTELPLKKSETIQLYSLLNRLNIYAQQEVINSIAKDKDGKPRSIRHLSRKEGSDLLMKIKAAIRNGRCKQFEEIGTQSSFEIESDSE